LNKKVNYYLTGTCYNFELEEFLSWFCQRQLGILVIGILQKYFTCT